MDFPGIQLWIVPLFLRRERTFHVFPSTNSQQARVRELIAKMCRLIKLFFFRKTKHRIYTLGHFPFPRPMTHWVKLQKTVLLSKQTQAPQPSLSNRFVDRHCVSPKLLLLTLAQT